MYKKETTEILINFQRFRVGHQENLESLETQDTKVTYASSPAFFFFNIFIGVLLLYNGVLVSAL